MWVTRVAFNDTLSAIYWKIKGWYLQDLAQSGYNNISLPLMINCSTLKEEEQRLFKREQVGFVLWLSTVNICFETWVRWDWVVARLYCLFAIEHEQTNKQTYKRPWSPLSGTCACETCLLSLLHSEQWIVSLSIHLNPVCERKLIHSRDTPSSMYNQNSHCTVAKSMSWSTNQQFVYMVGCVEIISTALTPVALSLLSPHLKNFSHQLDLLYSFEMYTFFDGKAFLKVYAWALLACCITSQWASLFWSPFPSALRQRRRWMRH